MTLDRFLGRSYHRQNYNCAHLSIDVWEYVTGRTAPPAVVSFLVPGQTPSKLGHVQGVRLLDGPLDPCFVLMRSKVREPHMGVYYKGRVLHFAGNNRVHYQPLELVTVGYTSVRYFTC